MNKIDKHSVSKSGGFIPQAVWLIGTINEDGSQNFGTVTCVNYIPGPPEGLIVSLTAKRTKENILRTSEFTANLCTAEMASMADYAGAVSGTERVKDAMPFSGVPGVKVHVPVLDASPYVIECKMLQYVLMGDTHTFIAETLNQQIDIRCGQPKNDSYEAYIEWLNKNDIHDIDPLLYTWKYYKVGDIIGKVGELKPQP